MELLNLVLLQKDPRVARFLSGQLCHHFHAIHVVRSVPELRDLILRFPPDVVVVDMEAASLGDVQRLHREFANLCIVCTHRIADEEMWTAALDAGAADICSATDTRGIITAAVRNSALAHSAAA
jgi:DNA-binding response OmpR family regulator